MRARRFVFQAVLFMFLAGTINLYCQRHAAKPAPVRSPRPASAPAAPSDSVIYQQMQSNALGMYSRMFSAFQSKGYFDPFWVEHWSWQLPNPIAGGIITVYWAASDGQPLRPASGPDCEHPLMSDSTSWAGDLGIFLDPKRVIVFGYDRRGKAWLAVEPIRPDKHI